MKKERTMQTYLISLTVDNNRYGVYYKVYCSRIMVIVAHNPEDAYYIAANVLTNERRYKNAVIRHYKNIGDHDDDSWSINFKAWAFAPKEYLTRGVI